MMSDSTDSPTRGAGLLSVLNAATEMRLAVLASCFVLFADSVLVVARLPSVLTLAGGQPLPDKINLAVLTILLFVGFSFVSGVLVPIIATFVHPIFRLFVYFVIRRGHLSPNVKEDGYVRESQLRTKAHESKESYYLDLLATWRSARDDTIEAQNRYACLAISWLILFAANISLGWRNDSTLAVHLATFAGLRGYIGWLFVLPVGLLYIASATDEPDWVYCPTLYRELEEKLEQEKLALRSLISNPIGSRGDRKLSNRKDETTY